MFGQKVNKNHLGIPTHQNGSKISFLISVNDCTIFTKGSQTTFTNTNRLLDSSCALSNQLVNFN